MRLADAFTRVNDTSRPSRPAARVVASSCGSRAKWRDDLPLASGSLFAAFVAYSNSLAPDSLETRAVADAVVSLRSGNLDDDENDDIVARETRRGVRHLRPAFVRTYSFLRSLASVGR